MAVEGVDQGVLNQEEADTFVAVHAELDRLMEAETAGMSGGVEARQQEMLAQLVHEGTITPEEADLFTIFIKDVDKVIKERRLLLRKMRIWVGDSVSRC